MAFFPGTFDPFSAGHKRIVEEICRRGFEVYLAVDEFSWSKRTLPKLLRRQIVSMSVSNLWNVYLFPDDIPVNIAMPEDLKHLREIFNGRDMYLVAGSDVIQNASAYDSNDKGSAAYYDHILFSRVDSKQPGGNRQMQGVLKRQGTYPLPACLLRIGQLHPNPGVRGQRHGNRHAGGSHGAGVHLRPRPVSARLPIQEEVQAPGTAI